jgi:hypothetical protein
MKKKEKAFFGPFEEWYLNFIWDPGRDSMANKIQKIYSRWINANWKLTENLSIMDQARATFFAGFIISGQADYFDFENEIDYSNDKIHVRLDIFFESEIVDGYKQYKKLKPIYLLKEFFQAIFMSGFSRPFDYHQIQRHYEKNRTRVD